MSYIMLYIFNLTVHYFISFFESMLHWNKMCIPMVWKIQMQLGKCRTRLLIGRPLSHSLLPWRKKSLSWNLSEALMGVMSGDGGGMGGGGVGGGCSVTQWWGRKPSIWGCKQKQALLFINREKQFQGRFTTNFYIHRNPVSLERKA